MEQKTKQAEKEISATEKALKELSQARQTEMEQCRNEISVILEKYKFDLKPKITLLEGQFIPEVIFIDLVQR
jgi:hypothetical protein